MQRHACKQLPQKPSLNTGMAMSCCIWGPAPRSSATRRRFACFFSSPRPRADIFLSLLCPRHGRPDSPSRSLYAFAPLPKDTTSSQAYQLYVSYSVAPASRKMDSTPVSEELRSCIRAYCTALVAALNRYYAFGSVFVDDAQ